MEFRILVVLLLVLSIRAQYSPRVPCTSDESCKPVAGPAQQTKCLQSMCMCLNSTVGKYAYCSMKDIVSSRSNAAAARDCHNDTDCAHIQGAKCYAKESRRMCDCDPQMLLSGDGERCLEIAAGPGSSCLESAQCSTSLDGAECMDGSCRCRGNFHYVEARRRCVISRGYGESCFRDDESCYQISKTDGKNTLGCSDNNTCKCLKSYVHVDGLCQNSAKRQTVLHFSLVLLMVVFTNDIF